MGIPESLQRDAEELSGLTGCKVDLVPEANQIGIVVKQATLPSGTYTKTASDVLMLTDYQYSMSAMDMFYMEPEVQHRTGAVPAHASSVEQHIGRPWRRWSWHRNGIWIPGTDNLLSHWAFVEACWAKERAA